MRGKTLINELENLKDRGIRWPEPEDTKFSRFLHRLEALVEKNMPQTEVVFCEEQCVFFVKIHAERYVSRRANVVPHFRLERSVALDPHLPLIPQMDTLIQIHEYLNELADSLMDEMDVFRLDELKVDGTAITKKTRAVAHSIVAHTDFQKTLRKVNGDDIPEEQENNDR